MKKIPFFLPLLLLFFVPTAKADFPDVPTNSEYYQSIGALQNLGLVKGYENGNFDMNREVSRAEFIKISLMADMHNDSPYKSKATFPGVEAVDVSLNCFPDVTEADWFAPYVCWAKEKGIVSGYADGHFYPHRTVSVAEAAKILARGNGSAEVEVGGPWPNLYFRRMVPHTLPSAVESADQLLTRAITAEMVWRYRLADEDQLESKSSKILVWDGQKFLDLDYLGKVIHYPFEYYYGRYENKIYGVQDPYSDFIAKELTGADVDTFEVFNAKPQDVPYYPFAIAMDKNALYMFNEPIAGSVGGTYEVLDEYFSNGFNGVYYAKDDENVYPITCYEGCILHDAYPDVDPDSFQALDIHFSKDKNHVYYIDGGFKASNTPVILEADSSTFEKVNFNPDTTALCESPFFKDKDHVYLFSKMLADVDAASFEMVQDYGFFFKDKNNIYRAIHEAKGPACSPTNAIKIENADMATFKPLGSNYFLSQNKIYYINGQGSVLLTTANPATFKTYPVPEGATDPDIQYSLAGLGKDDTHVYYNGQILNGVDLETFHYSGPLDSSFSAEDWSDKNGSYSWADIYEMVK